MPSPSWREGRNQHAMLLCRAAQFAEETKRADWVVPWGIVLSVLGTAILGSSYLLTLLFCIPGVALCTAPVP